MASKFNEGGEDEDPWEVLGVDENATEKEINTAYRKLSKLCHPDKCPDDPDAAEKFEYLTAAKDLMLDPKAMAAAKEKKRLRLQKQKAEEERKLRFAEMDEARQQLVLDLERREAEAERRRNEANAAAVSAASMARAREAAGVAGKQDEDNDDEKKEEVLEKFFRLAKRRRRIATMEKSAARGVEERGLPAPLKALLERFKDGSMPKMTVPSVKPEEVALLRQGAAALGFFTELEGTSLVLCKEREEPQKSLRTEMPAKENFSAKHLFSRHDLIQEKSVISSCEHCGMPFKSTNEILTHVKVCTGSKDLLHRSGRKKIEPEKIAEKPLEDSECRRTVEDPFDVPTRKRKADPFDVAPPLSKASKGGLSAKERQMAALAKLEAKRAQNAGPRTQFRNIWTEQESASAFCRPELLSQEKADRQRAMRDEIEGASDTKIPEWVTGPGRSVPSIDQFNSGSAKRLVEQSSAQELDSEFKRPSASKKGMPGKLKFKEAKQPDAEPPKVVHEVNKDLSSAKELLQGSQDSRPVLANASTPDVAMAKPKKKGLFAAYA